MKIDKKYFIVLLNRLSHFFGPILVFSLIAIVSGMSQPQTPVNLRSTTNFVVLAGSLISNIPTSDITGDIGLSPAAGSNITGIGSTEVTGAIFTVDGSGPSGSIPAAAKLTDAKEDLTIAYNDAAERTPVPTGKFLNPGSGNIGGMTLTSGLYKFTSGVSITGSDVTLTGNVTDVWIFQISSNLAVGNGMKVTLAGGATAANVFWQVGTSATLGTTSEFKGTIMADQSISLNTGAILNGRALARTGAVTLASNRMVKPETVTDVKNEIVLQPFGLSQNYPNPFNPSTIIKYSLEKASQVSLKIYSLLGLEAVTLVNGNQEAGTYAVSFTSNKAISNLPSGVYFYRLKAGSFVSTKKLILVK